MARCQGRHGKSQFPEVFVVSLLLVAVLAAPPHTSRPAFKACVKAEERGRSIQELPNSWRLELVGVGFDRKLRPTVVIRSGNGRKAASSVYSEGDKIYGRLRVVKVGATSVLLRMDNALYTLKLKNRTSRDWSAFITGLPTCNAKTPPKVH